ncbi:LysR substrate-binding domain-containing protein [Marilutibacter aestuarii]|uniref:LysR family transcriptional regulator n=1 Tax=Marilutibacter aestuarii TaxID=1706195 RepID=A0A508ARU9_9GAMM|nr:LysR substrate-binding domain-containing protein [Lysobacter aestuarii]TQD51673.1 LysR family transcriptional regulator [Lysobacter aestuarii]
MTLKELRCLLAIVDAELNISAAAEIMHASQPSLSRHLKLLEDELGFQILMRHGRSISGITPAGQEVIRLARRVVNDVASIRAYAANVRGEETGDLVLTTPQTYARHVLPPVLSTLIQRYPRLNVRIQNMGEGAAPERACDNGGDMMLVSTAGDRVPPGVALPLFRWKRMVLVPRGHALARLDRPVALGELARHALVTYESSRRSDSSLCRALSDAGLRARFACSAEDADLIKVYVRAGLGVGLVGELALEPADHQEFVVLPADPALPECVAWAILPTGRVVRDYALDLIQLLAPQLDVDDIRRAVDGSARPAWPRPRLWQSDYEDVGTPVLPSRPISGVTRLPMQTTYLG